MNTPNTVRMGTLVAAGSALALILIWTMCGRGGPHSTEVAEQAAPPSAPVVPEVIPPAPPALLPEEEAVAAEPIVPAAVPVVVPEPVAVMPPPPVAVAPPSLPPVAAAPPARAEPVVTPPVAVVPAAPVPVPDQDLLIAKSASSRFKPDVAGLATASLALRAPVQGDASLNVLQPCDTAASGCSQGLAPGQVIGGANDWSGFVLPGFPE